MVHSCPGVWVRVQYILCPGVRGCYYARTIHPMSRSTGTVPYMYIPIPMSRSTGLLVVRALVRIHPMSRSTGTVRYIHVPEYGCSTVQYIPCPGSTTTHVRIHPMSRSMGTVLVLYCSTSHVPEYGSTSRTRSYGYIQCPGVSWSTGTIRYIHVPEYGYSTFHVPEYGSTVLLRTHTSNVPEYGYCTVILTSHVPEYGSTSLTRSYGGYIISS